MVSQETGMNITNTERPKTGDPSGIEQHFQQFSVHLLCCHYWTLRAWKHSNLSFPYWRIYWNRQSGATIFHEDVMVNLHPDMIYLIPPNTPYSCFYDPHGLADGLENYCVGGPVLDTGETNSGSVDHFFLHFNLGLPFDSVKPQLFQISPTSELKRQLKACCEFAIGDGRVFGLRASLSIISLIGSLLQGLPEGSWDQLSRDARVEKILRYIEQNLGEELSNAQLARKANMATNSFSRLFRSELGVSLGQYILKIRLERACMNLHHSEDSIDLIAEQCGFCDRHHFSRMFKKCIGVSPALYRKRR